MKIISNRKSLLTLLVMGFLAVNAMAGEADFHIQWGGTNVIAHGGWGRMIHLTNGDWLAVNTRYEKTQSTLEVRVSTNCFQSWSKISEVVEPGRFMDNGELIQLQQGEILLTGRSLIDQQSYYLPVYRSTDGGRNWTPWSNIDSNEGPPGSLIKRGLWEPHFFVLKDGRLAVAYSSEVHSVDKPGYGQICSERISEDGGKTWGREIVLVAEPGGGALRPGMPVVVLMQNGKFIAIYEVVGMGDAQVFCKTSDDGEHWPPGLGNQIVGQHAGPWVTSLSDGTLLATSCTNHVAVSHDFGTTWFPVEPPPWNFGAKVVFTWPAIYELDTNEIAALVEHREVEIRFGRITK